MNAAFTSLIERELNLKVKSMQPVSGGCINDAFALTSERLKLFVKAAGPAAIAIFEAEAAGLQELARAKAVRVPEVVGIGSNEDAAFIALEWIDCKPANRTIDARFGEQLAQLHGTVAATFGWTRDNTIGRTPQRNTPTTDWLSFWRDARLQVQLQLAESNSAPRSLLEKGARLLGHLPQWLERHSPAASLVHGDLWSGNRASDTEGRPVIFDPAVYYGDRETDLAMMTLFGGFSDECYQQYHATWPLPDGHELRVELYQLYHVLNHFNLFGGGYAAQSEHMMDRLLTQR